MPTTFHPGSNRSVEPAKPTIESKPDGILRLFSCLFGAFLSLTLLKFGNPPIMEQWVGPPENLYEFFLGTPWPITWAYVLLGITATLGLFVSVRVRNPHGASGIPRWLLSLPLFWLAWQVVATSQSLSAPLSAPTLKHFVACIVCFYLGFYCLSHNPRLKSFWPGLFCGFLLVLAFGWEQHFGGLAATRDFFFREIYPQLKEIPPEYLKKMSSNRIFSTLFYPNALAGALLLFLPGMLAITAQARQLLTGAARGFVCTLLVVGALGCLYWSGSKGGWLLMLLIALVGVLRLQFSSSLKIAIVVVVLLTGLTGFAFKYAGFFRKGATSVSARFDYWRAALETATSHPLTGTGPGTFMIPYGQIKTPESEMTRMVHNDYLEQASDSGWIGFAVYCALVWAGLIYSGRSIFARGETGPPESARNDWMVFSIWLGLLGWALQGLFEFGLYIPALAWPAFTFLGFLLAQTRNGIDKRRSNP